MLNLILLIVFILAVMGMIRFKKLTIPIKILSGYLLFEFSFIIFDKYEITRYKINAPAKHVENLVTYIFFALIYYVLFKNKLLKKSILASIVIVTLFSIINALFLQPYRTTFPTYTMVGTNITYIILAVLLFNKMLLYPTEINIIKQSSFWYNTAIILFYAFVFLVSALGNYIKDHPANYAILGYFWYGFIVIFYVLLGVAILTDNKEIPMVKAQLVDAK
jgi:hypothetical protein